MKSVLRVSSNMYYKDSNFLKHIDFVKRNADTIDEVAIFVEYCHHAYLPLDELCERIEVIGKRMAEYRKAGIKSVGINVLNTLGQTDEAWDVMPPCPIPTMVSHDGKVSRSCFCPNNDAYREYTTKKFTMIAELRPDFIWLDDDLRMKNHGAQYVCFCDNCLSLFAEEYGKKFTREELAAVLNSPDGKEIRSNWIHHNNGVINNLLKFCESIIHGVNPAIKTGLMTSSVEEHDYSIHNLSEMTESLKAEKMRPGGGFYTDDSPRSIFIKMICTDRQAAFTEGKISDVQYEFENYPYLIFSKSRKMIDFESTASLMCGCNGVLYNTHYNREDIAEIVRERRPQWNTITDYAKNSKSLGVNILYNNLVATRKDYDGDFFSNPEIWTSPAAYDVIINVGETGLAMAASPEDACAFILTSDMADGYTDGEITDILTRGVMMDAVSAGKLIKRGFGKHLGVSIENTYYNGVEEIFTDHPINGDTCGYVRSYATTFFSRDPEKSATCTFLPQDDAEVIAELYTIRGDRLGASFVVFENSLGGRVAISGYTTYSFMRSPERMKQIHNVIDWISKKSFPITFSRPLKFLPVVRKNDKNYIIFLGNCNFDEEEDFSFDIRCKNTLTPYEITKTGELLKADALKKEDGISVKVDKIDGWSWRVFVLKEN